MNPLNPNNPGLWGSWSWNDSDEKEGSLTPANSPKTRWVYPPGEPPEPKPDHEIKDWPSVPFGD